MEVTPDAPVFFTGHSLGGALATLAAVEARLQMPTVKVSLYTFGCPRVFSKGMSNVVDQLLPRCFRVVVDGDIVAGVPVFGYRHVGTLAIIDPLGNAVINPSFVEKVSTVCSVDMKGEQGRFIVG